MNYYLNICIHNFQILVLSFNLNSSSLQVKRMKCHITILVSVPLSENGCHTLAKAFCNKVTEDRARLITRPSQGHPLPPPSCFLWFGTPRTFCSHALMALGVRKAQLSSQTSPHSDLQVHPTTQSLIFLTLK